MTDIRELRKAVDENTVPGGSAFGRVVAEIFALTAESQASEDPAKVRAAIQEVADWAERAKPSMASVHNVTHLARSAISDNSPDLATRVSAVMASFIAASEAALAKLATVGAGVVRRGDVILVHSYSGSLERVLTEAARTVDDIHILFTESRPYRESRRLIAALTKFDCAITLYSDAAVAVAADRATLAMVGADAILRDGSFVNKTGTLPLALSCRARDTPLYVVSELSKVFPGDPDQLHMEQRPPAELETEWEPVRLGRVDVVNQFFERVPGELVTTYLTERGAITSSQIAQPPLEGTE